MCELSSYQIADLTVGPEVAVLTNLYREHTDWHGSEEQYRADKLRLFELPGVRAAVRPLGDRGGWPLVVPPEQIPLRGRAQRPERGHRGGGDRGGRASTAAAAARGARWACSALPHRLQTVHTDARGVEWIDDSISTTPESTIAALEAFGERPVVLIAGGSERDQDYGELGETLAARAAPTHLILLPDTGRRLAAAAASHGFGPDRMSTAGDMREATRLAPGLGRARRGRAALTGRARASTSTRNFEERGDDFATLALRA